MKNRLIFIIGIILFSLLTFKTDTIADEDSEGSCSYRSEIDQCVNENKNGDPRSIEDFVCIQHHSEELIAYQVVLDDKFKEFDEEIEDYLDKLEKSPNYCFGKDKQVSYLECIQDIIDQFKIHGKYWELHNKACDSTEKDSIIQETVSCMGGKTTVLNVKDFFTDTDCMGLANFKMSIYLEVAFDVLKVGKQTVIKDDRKDYTKEEISTFDEVIDLFMINLGYLERIWMKWPSKTKYPV